MVKYFNIKIKNLDDYKTVNSESLYNITKSEIILINSHPMPI